MVQKEVLSSLGALTLVCLLGLLPSGIGAAAAPEFKEIPTLTANPNPRVPLAAVVRFAADQPVYTTIAVSDGKHEWELNYDDSRKPENGLPVLGMRPNHRHEIRVSIRNAAGSVTRAAKALEFTTPPLPSESSEFPPLQVRASQPDRMEPGVTILSVRRVGQRRQNSEFSTGYGLLLGLDAEGEVVWYYRCNARISDVEPLRNGNIVYVTHDFRAVEIDMLGNVVAEWYAAKRPQGAADAVPVDTLTFHHAIEEVPSGNLLVLGTELREIDNYYTSATDPDAPRKTQKVMGDEVVEFQRDGKAVWRWNAFENLDPFFLGVGTLGSYWVPRGFPDTLDWTHGNGLYYDERDDSVLLNLRMLSAVLKLDHASGKIRWILSEPGVWPEEHKRHLLQPDGAMDWPWYQHAPSITPAGNVMVYNNGSQSVRVVQGEAPSAERYSRAAEFSIDPDKGTVRHVWSSEEFGPDSVITGAMGDADWLPRTGNVLVCYGASRIRDEKTGAFRPWPRVREVTHTQPAEVLYEVVLADDSAQTQAVWQLFGAERVASLGP